MEFFENEFEERPFLLIEEEDGWASDVEYFASDAISNSDLRVFEVEGPAVFWAYKYSKDFIKKPPTVSQEFGTLLHTLIYEEQEYSKRYYQFTGKKPSSPQMEAFCEQIDEGIDIVVAYMNSYSTRDKSAETIREKAEFLYDELYQYITGLRRRGKKKLITQIVLDNAKAAKENYLLHPQVMEFSELIAKPYCTHLTECGVYWESAYGFNCRAKIDEVIIDHASKVIYKNDLKSTYNSNPISFGKSYIKTNQDGYDEIGLTGSLAKWGYDEQIAFYDKAINESSFRKDHNCEGYQIVNTVFAIRNTYPFNANAYRFTPKAVASAAHKIEEKMNNIAQFMSLKSKDFLDWQDYGQQFNNSKGLFII